MVVSMTREFMIHGAIHWGNNRSDDMTLWTFTLDFEAWLYIMVYNLVSQENSMLTYLEKVSCCKSDHKDLICTHAWNFSCYVLNYELQNKNFSQLKPDTLDWGNLRGSWDRNLPLWHWCRFIWRAQFPILTWKPLVNTSQNNVSFLIGSNQLCLRDPW